MKNTIGLSGTFFLSVLVSVFAGAQQTPQAPVKLTNQDCLSCHADNAPVIDPKAFDNSVHQTLDCIDCHKDIKELPHTDKLQKVDCSVCHEKEALAFSHSDHAKAMVGNSLSEASCTSCHGNPHAILEADDPHSPVNRKNIPLTCSGCHQKQHSVLLAKEGKTYLSSVHGLEFQKGSDMKAAVCSDCHGAHDINKPANRLSRLYWVNIPKTCGQCHKEEYKQYTRGIHGQALAAGSRDTPVCTDCHGEHDIEAVKRASSRVSSANIPQTCGQCHAAERINAAYGLPGNVLGSYMQSYHGLAMQQGAVTAANCASCHGAHEILPSSDPRSTINPRNLEKTCGQCHPGIGARVAQGSVHGGFKNGGNPVNDWVRRFYIFFIFFVSGALLLHNLLDFSGKAMVHYRRSLEQGRMCMGFDERCQHFILTGTFIILAYTGFSLKFPQTWWSFMFFGHNDWLRWGHRGIGLVFCVLALYHLYYLFFTGKGRRQLKALSIRKEDCVQFFQSFQYYFGRRKDKPKPIGVYSYVQKLEYWALLWGSLVMVATGVLMFSEVWFLSMFPKWLYDVVRTVHLYEAILACVTIIIWHGYFVIFDPDVYPGNWSWLHGRSKD